jgi:predicted RNA-binding protein with PIN domain
MSRSPPPCCCTRRAGNAVADLYLFDGYNLLHAGGFADAREVRDALASYVALRGARGIVVFDGAGDLVGRGPLEVRYAPHADTLLERLAAQHRGRERVVLVTSDATLKAAAGSDVVKVASAELAAELQGAPHVEERPRGLAGKLDEETRARLERLRRGE